MEKVFWSAVKRVFIFTLLAQFLTLLITPKFYVSPIAEEVYEPFGRTIEGAVANSLPLLAVIFLFSLFILFLVKLKKLNLIKAIVVGFLLGSVFSINSILLSTIFPDSTLPILFSTSLSILILLSAYSKKFRFLSKFFSLIIASEVAAYFSTILRPPTVLIFPILLAVYDIYAVFAGPLKKIIGKPKKVGKAVKVKLDFLPFLIVDFGFIKVGLGDIIFYSMLPSVAFMVYGIERMLVTLLATNLGVLTTLFILRKKRIPLPGLPIPMLLGVISLIL
ncbi:MAG: hypothetical protein QXG39_02185 [Candidatus Aenigmatarchaeota archaeon]